MQRYMLPWTLHHHESLGWIQVYNNGTSILGFPGGSVVKNPPANAGNVGSFYRSGRSLGVGNGNPLQYR